MRGLLAFVSFLAAIGATTPAFGDTVIPTGTVSGIWTAAESPYLIEGDIAIHADSVLTIEPGVVVNFQGHYHLAVNGALLAVGTAEDSILFTAADTEIGWKGIRINEGIDSTRLEYCIAEHGHRTGSSVTDWR